MSDRAGSSVAVPGGRPGGLWAFATFGCLAALGPASTNMYLPALPQLTADLDASPAVGQLTLSLTFAGLALGQLFVGPLSDRLGRRTPALWGLAAFVLFTLGCAFAPNAAILLVMRFLQGAAGSCTWVLARAAVRDLHTGASAARMFSRLTLITGVAPMLSPVIGGQLLTVTDWRGIFVVLAAIAFLVGVFTWFFFRETRSAKARAASAQTNQVHQMAAILRDARFVSYLVIAGMLGVVLISYLSMTPLILENEHGLDPGQVSLVFAVAALLSVMVNQLNGSLVMRLGPGVLLRFALAATVVLAVGLTLVLALDAPMPVLIAALMVGPAFTGAAMANLTSIVLIPYGHAAGAASALQGMAQFLVGATVPPLITALTATATATAFGALGAGAIAFSVILFLRARPHERPRSTKEHHDAQSERT